MDALPRIIMHWILWPAVALWILVVLIVLWVRAIDAWRSWEVWRQSRDNRRQGFDVLARDQMKSPPDQSGDT